jgi:hypothetical protein
MKGLKYWWSKKWGEGKTEYDSHLHLRTLSAKGDSGDWKTASPAAESTTDAFKPPELPTLAKSRSGASACLAVSHEPSSPLPPNA